MSFVPQTKGLLNKPGQNNCFLNSAVQVLWHLDVFRRSFRELTGHACLGHESCIFCALKELFTQFQYSRETVLPPDSLRRALAETFSDQRRFQLGFMDDAAECFENMLLRLHCHLAPQESEDNCKAAHCISHEKFAMNLVEQIICTACGATSEALPFTQMVHYVSTPALCHQAKSFSLTTSTISFGELLRSAGALGDIRDCPKACGARVHIKRTLYNKPDIVSIGLVWDSERPSINHISDVFRVIGTSLRLQDVFDDPISPSKQGMCKLGSHKNSILQLAGLVTYYGKHFSTFFYHTELESWIYFDDAAVREIGPHWEQVVEKCIRGHFQPLLLLYTNPNGTAVDTTKAPKTITMMPKSTSHSNNPSSLSMKRNPSLIPKNLQLKPLHYQSTNHARQMVRPGHLRPYRPLPGSVDDLLNNCNSASEDVPDSPLTKSSSSSAYFSDIGEVENGYLSRQAVDSIFNFQQLKQRKQRSSSSSVDSFYTSNKKNLDCPSIPNKVCSLQRCDSGNSSNSSANGDRHSSSSGSIVTSENPYFGLSIPNLSNLSQLRANQLAAGRQLIGSDCGYDSFSISSSDSYPASGGPPTPVKQNRNSQQRLSQIPEDVQYMDLINNSNLQDCDKLCSEADILLLKSHEKEREGDIRTAALLSDSAAQKARSAMDAPYSNPQTMISAKIKHSMCVMRSASLHRRVKEAEAEEKRRLKAEQLEIQHSRQGSRDSSSGKHSRQSSKDSTLKESVKKEAEPPQSAKTLELYATLPKKNAKKKLLESSSQILSSSLRLKEDRRGSIPSILDSLRNSRKAEKLKETKSDVESVCSVQLPVKRNLQKVMSLSKESDSNYSDYYSEFEVNKPSKLSLQRNNSGSGSCRESEYYGEFEQLNKKQNRVRRKLLIGGFMKRKNRSLPDLREGSNPDANDSEIKALDDSGAKSVAQVSRKGFHKISGLGNQGVGSQRTSLIKVNTPHVDCVMPKIASNMPKLSETPNKSAISNCSRTPNSHSKSEYRRFNTPPPPEVIPPCLKSTNANIGIEPNEELPPPPEDFLLDLRETRMDTVDSLISDQPLGRTQSDTLPKRIQTKPITSVCSVDDLNKQSALPSPSKSEISSNATPTCKSVIDVPKVNNNVKSVKDLALKFERLATTCHVNSSTTSVPENELISISPQPTNILQSPVLSAVPQLVSPSPLPPTSPQLISESPVPPTPPQSIPQSPISYYNRNSLSALRSGTSPSTGLRVVALLGTNLRVGQDTCNASQLHQVSPVSPITSSPCMSPSNKFLSSRPEKPPDYQTAMKRLGLMKAEMTNILQQQNNRLSTSSMDNYNGQQLSFAEECRSKRKCGPKKSVSFSDEVVLVASAEFEEEEHFPNPLLERILAKSNILSMTDKSQEITS